MHTIIVPPHQLNTIHFQRYILFIVSGNNIIRQGRKLITKIAVSVIIMFAVYYVCWLEDAVCSEIKNENTIEYCRLPQCDRTQEYKA